MNEIVGLTKEILYSKSVLCNFEELIIYANPTSIFISLLNLLTAGPMKTSELPPYVPAICQSQTKTGIGE